MPSFGLDGIGGTSSANNSRGVFFSIAVGLTFFARSISWAWNLAKSENYLRILVRVNRETDLRGSSSRLYFVDMKVPGLDGLDPSLR